MAIEPLAEEFIADVDWQDLDRADEIYPVPVEEEIPELVGCADLVVSINTLDHGRYHGGASPGALNYWLAPRAGASGRL